MTTTKRYKFPRMYRNSLSSALDNLIDSCRQVQTQQKQKIQKICYRNTKKINQCQHQINLNYKAGVICRQSKQAQFFIDEEIRYQQKIKNSTQNGRQRRRSSGSRYKQAQYQGQWAHLLKQNRRKFGKRCAEQQLCPQQHKEIPVIFNQSINQMNTFRQAYLQSESSNSTVKIQQSKKKSKRETIVIKVIEV